MPDQQESDSFPQISCVFTSWRKKSMILLAIKHTPARTHVCVHKCCNRIWNMFSRAPKQPKSVVRTISYHFSGYLFNLIAFKRDVHLMVHCKWSLSDNCVRNFLVHPCSMRISNYLSKKSLATICTFSFIFIFYL